MVKYRLTNEAVKDLENIWVYTSENFSVEQADRYYYLIIDEISFISIHPNAGRPMAHVKKGYRVAIVKSHLIFYRIRSDKVVIIVRILHQSMDVETRI